MKTRLKLTNKQRRALTRIVLAAALLAAAWSATAFIEMPWWAALALFAAPYLVCGFDVLFKAGSCPDILQQFEDIAVIKFLVIQKGNQVFDDD